MSLGLLRGLAILAGGAYLAGRRLRRELAESRRQRQVPPAPPEPITDELVRDPICGTYVPSRQAVVEICGGERHHFCSDECRQVFLRRHREQTP